MKIADPRFHNDPVGDASNLRYYCCKKSLTQPVQSLWFLKRFTYQFGLRFTAWGLRINYVCVSREALWGKIIMILFHKLCKHRSEEVGDHPTTVCSKTLGSPVRRGAWLFLNLIILTNAGPQRSGRLPRRRIGHSRTSPHSLKSHGFLKNIMLFLKKSMFF